MTELERDEYQRETASLRMRKAMKLFMGAPKPKGPPPKPIVEEPVTAPAGVVTGLHEATMAVRPNECHWPLGAPEDPQFHYCGAKSLKQFGYCERHRKQSLQVKS